MNDINDAIAMERLRKAVFDADAPPDDAGPDDLYPNTPAERVNYAHYIATKAVARLTDAILRLNRFDRLCAVGGNDLPKIILHNEAKVALERLMHAKIDVDDAVGMIRQVMADSWEVPCD